MAPRLVPLRSADVEAAGYGGGLRGSGEGERGGQC
jgi:hypothetical protein